MKVRLVAFDFNGVIGEFALHKYVSHSRGGKQAIQNSKKWMMGEISFRELYEKNTLFHKGITKKEVQELAEKGFELPYKAEEVFAFLKEQSVKTAFISGEYQELLDLAKEKLGVDYAFGTKAVYDSNGVHTGKLVEPIIDEQEKARILKKICRKEGIPLKETVAVVNQWNDRELAKTAGYSIGYNPDVFIKKMTSENVRNMEELKNSLMKLIKPTPKKKSK